MARCPPAFGFRRRLTRALDLMNAAERIAEKYLQHVGHELVEFEPDGNVTPDFLVNKRVAVEVRRLNQNHEDASGNTRGLEETAIP